MLRDVLDSLMPRHAAVAVALLASTVLAQTPASAVRVTGSVLDSLTNAPLAAASIEFARADDPAFGRVRTRTDAAGRFDTALSPGRWLVGIEHPHLDSLGVTLPVRRVEIPARPAVRLALATASARTLTGAYCGEQARDDDVALVGMLHAAGSDGPLDSATVLVQWTDLGFSRGAVVRTVPTVTARTDRNGWFILCGIPKSAELVAWAERGSAASGLINAETRDGPTRLDLWLDPSSTVSAGVSDTVGVGRAVLSAERRRPPVRSGTARLRVRVRDVAGQPVPGAHARITGHRFARGNPDGTVTLDSLPGGSQTLEVLALGFVPVIRVVHLAASDAAVDTVTLTSTNALLDTIRVSTGRVYSVDATGFEARRKSGIGSYLTSADVARWQPFQLTSLLQAHSGVVIQDTRDGDQLIKLQGVGGVCTPAVWVNGTLEVYPSGPSAGIALAPPGQTPNVGQKGTVQLLSMSPVEPAGLVDLNWIVRPSDIDGVEIYRRPAEVPPQFVVGGYGECGAIVIWTRSRLVLPQTPPPPSAPDVPIPY